MTGILSVASISFSFFKAWREMFKCTESQTIFLRIFQTNHRPTKKPLLPSHGCLTFTRRLNQKPAKALCPTTKMTWILSVASIVVCFLKLTTAIKICTSNLNRLLFRNVDIKQPFIMVAWILPNAPSFRSNGAKMKLI